MKIRAALAALAALGLVLLGACSSTTTAPAATPAASQGHQAVSPSAEVIAQRMGLTKAPGYVAYTASTDPNHLLGRQNGYTSKINWGPDGNTGTMDLAHAALDVLADGATPAEVRRTVEMAIALPVVMPADQIRDQLAAALDDGKGK